MERAVEKCEKTLLVCTPNWVESEFTNFESLLLQTEDPINIKKKILPLMLKTCKLPRRLNIFTYADFNDENEREFQLKKLVKQIKADFEKQEVKKKVYPSLAEENIEITRLPQTGYELFGRQKELKLLNETWESGELNVLAFVAYGGVGKSTLINKWVEKVRWDNFRGAKKVFAWSFYSQGTGEKVTSADLFIKAALTYFDDENPEQGSPWDKGERLAKLVRQDKTLLLLDGLEPLQSALEIEKGKIKDNALATLIIELAKNNNGLCLITTREDIPELDRYSDSTKKINLEQISDEAGRALLRVRGVTGTDAELESVTQEFGNHALAINLLAEYLHLIPGHPAKKANEIPDLDIPQTEGRHPRRVIEAFAAYFGEGAELELLRILGLFDRPAGKTAINAVIKDTQIKGLTDFLHRLSESDWLRLLNKLRDVKLIAPESKHRPNAVDCHPLVREHFGEKLQTTNPKAWKEANNRLYEYFKNLPQELYGKEQPDTLEEMEPLFMAVAFGCRAGFPTKVWEEIYWKKINRDNEAYCEQKLGAFGSHLAALSNFFEIPWNKPTKEVSDQRQALLLSFAGFGLRALGRLREAAQPMQAGMEMQAKNEDWQNAASAAGNLSELYLTLGDVEQAVAFGRQSVEFADKSGDEFQRLLQRTAHADALHQKAYFADAKEIFIEAEKIEKERGGYNYLYSFQGFRFCDLLLSQGQYEEVQKRANQSLKIVRNLISIALDKLSLGRAYLQHTQIEGTKNYTQASRYLKEAVEGLRESGYQDDLPRGLLARAELYRVREQFAKTWEDLEEAREIAERGEMRLHLTNYNLEAARVCLAEIQSGSGKNSGSGSLNSAREYLEEAKRLVEETKYFRREPEAELGYAKLFLMEGAKDKAGDFLVNAKKLLDKMGIRMWDEDVKDIEKRLED